jgi:hypothetical protein
MQKGVFNITPDSGQGDGNISISALKYTGREAPADAIFRLRKSGGGLETRRVVVKQPAYPEFFRIDTITKRENTDGTTDLTIECTGNVLLSSVICGAKDFYGMSLTTGKSWTVKINGATVSEFSPTLRADGYGVTIDSYSGSSEYGKVSSYNLTAYLTIPANTDSLSKSYDFYFGVPVWSSSEMPQVGMYNTSKTLDSASKYFGEKIIIDSEGQGTLVVSPQDISFTSEETDPNKRVSVSVRASSTWEIDASSVPDWLEIWGVDNNSFVIIPKSSNTTTSKRTANIVVRLTNGSVSTECKVTQTGKVGTSIYMNLYGQNYWEYKSMGATATLSISASGPFTLSGFPSWIEEGSHTGTTGSDYGEVVTITVLPLESETETREAEIVATLDGTGMSSMVTIYQRPTDNIQVVSASEGELIKTTTARFGGRWTLTTDAGGTQKDITFGLDSNCIWTTSSLSDGYEIVDSDSSSITIRLKRSSSSTTTYHSFNVYGEHHDMSPVAGVSITWPGE